MGYIPRMKDEWKKRVKSAISDSGLSMKEVSQRAGKGVAESWEWEDGQRYAVYVPDLPEYKSLKLYAAETRGPSMNRRYLERTVVVFLSLIEAYEEPIVGKRYVIERKRPSGEVEHTVKLLHADSDGKLWLMPESDDPRFQVPIAIEDGTASGDSVTIVGRVVFAVTRE